MLRWILIITGIVTLSIAGLFAYAAMNAGALANRYKPELEKIAGNSLGAAVSLGEFDVSVFPEPHIQINRVKISDKKGSSEGAALEDVRLHFRLMPLLSGQLDIVELGLNRPHLPFVRDEHGIFLLGLQPRPKKEKKAGAKGGSEETPKKKEKPQTSLKVGLKSLRIDDASIELNDTVAGRTLHYDHVNLKSSLELNGGSLTLSGTKIQGKFEALADLNLQSAPVKVDLETHSFKADSVELSLAGNKLSASVSSDGKRNAGEALVKSDRIDIASLVPLAARFSPQVENYKLAGVLKPSINAQFGGGGFKATGTIDVDKVALQSGDKNIKDLTGRLTLDCDTDAKRVTAEKLNLALSGAPLVLHGRAIHKQNTLQLEDLEVAAFRGTIKGSARSALDGEKELATRLTAAGVDIESALAALKPGGAAKIIGSLEKLSVDLTGRLQGDIAGSLAGTGSITVNDGKLIGVNLGGKVLQAVTEIPFISGSLYDKVPEDRRSELKSDDTFIKHLQASYRIKNKSLQTDDLRLDSSQFTLHGSGTVGFDSSVDFKAEIVFTEALSMALVATTKELKNILDRDKRLVLPLRIKGTLPEVIVYPNVERLLKLGASRALRENAGELLDKALGGKSKGTGKAVGDLLEGLLGH